MAQPRCLRIAGPARRSRHLPHGVFIAAFHPVLSSRPCLSGAPAAGGIGSALLGSTPLATTVAATEPVFHVCRRVPAQGSIMRDISTYSPSVPTASVGPSTPVSVAASLPITGFVRAKLLLRLIPFSKATLWRRVKAGSFPGPVRLSEGITAWRVEDVRRWIQEAR